MKRFCVILASLLISIMTVFAGCGISVIKCAHTDAIAFAYNLEEEDCNAENDCHGDNHSRQPKPCMQIDVEQLAPSLSASSFHVDFSSLQPFMAIERWLLPDMQPSELSIDLNYSVQKKTPLPPRLYLRRLCVLNI